LLNKLGKSDNSMEVDSAVEDVEKPDLTKNVDLNEALDEIVFEAEEEDILSQS